jgi:hypothetical protein
MLKPEELNDLRKRVLAGEGFTYEELSQAVKQMIADRLSNFEKPTKAKAKSTPVNLDDLI